MKAKINFIFIVISFLAITAGKLQAETENNSVASKNLFDVIVNLDKMLFDEGFNQCKFEIWNSLVNEDLEFYDDRSGLNTSKDVEIASFKDRCGTNNISRIKRELIGTEIFTLKGFGAVQLGVHGFYLPNTTKSELVEIAKFIHIWEFKHEKWTVKRIVSYEHKDVNNDSKDVEADHELKNEILKMDSLLFDVAFNKCNLKLYKQLTTEDFEFYDDRSGLNKSIDKEIMSFEDRCSKPFSVTRKLVSSEAYELGNYGAVQIGVHDFYVDNQKVETAKFITIWERKNDAWIIKRAISYEHKEVINESNNQEKVAYTFRENYKDILDILVPPLLNKYQAPAAGIGIIENGKIEFIKVYGEHQKGVKATNDTIFNVASITKPVVAAAVLKLVEKGDWDLDEPLYHYFTDPDVAKDNRSKLITTRHCLSHTTGFKNWRWDEENGKLQFNFKPGTRFQYSGEGMEYLRHALEIKFKTGLEEIVNSLVFEPLNMKDATLGWLSDKDTMRFAKWYDTKGRLHNKIYETRKINAADDMLLTVEDILLFSNAIMKQELIKGPLYREMISPQATINDKLNQGLGWVVYDKLRNGEYILNHDGGDPGVVATLILFPKSKNGIVIFVNSDNGASITNSIVDNLIVNGMDVIEGLHWTNSIPNKVKIKEEFLKKYAGTYDTDHEFTITFTIDNQSLITESDVFPKLALYPMSENEFFPIPFEIYFKFIEMDNKINVQLLTPNKTIDLEGVKR